MRHVLICLSMVISLLMTCIPVHAYEGKDLTQMSTSVQTHQDSQSNVCQVHARYHALYQEFHQHQSPLVDHVNAFMHVCGTYGYDCYLLPAIAGVETGYGIANGSSHNPFGMADGKATYDDWEQSIEKAANILDKGYFAKGLTTIDQIGAVYAVDPLWSTKIKQRMADFHEEERKYGCILPNI